jgi:hypothetical protein
VLVARGHHLQIPQHTTRALSSCAPRPRAPASKATGTQLQRSSRAALERQAVPCPSHTHILEHAVHRAQAGVLGGELRQLAGGRAGGGQQSLRQAGCRGPGPINARRAAAGAARAAEREPAPREVWAAAPPRPLPTWRERLSICSWSASSFSFCRCLKRACRRARARGARNR